MVRFKRLEHFQAKNRQPLFLKMLWIMIVAAKGQCASGAAPRLNE